MNGHLLVLLVLTVWIYAFVDCFNKPEEQVRNLPKAAWLMVILLFGAVLAGPVAWLFAGRPRIRAVVDIDNVPDVGATPTEPVRWVAPDDNPEFLRSLDERLRRNQNDSNGGNGSEE